MTAFGEQGPWSDGESARATLQHQLEEAQAKARRAQTMQAQIQQLKIAARSRDGNITATVDASGALIDLHLTDDAVETDARTLTVEILDTVREARRLAGEAAVRLAQDAFGESSTAAAMLRSEVDQREAARQSGGLR